MTDLFKDGDRVEFIKGLEKGEKGTIKSISIAKDSSFTIGGIPWFVIQMDGGYTISGQIEGDFKKISDKRGVRV